MLHLPWRTLSISFAAWGLGIYNQYNPISSVQLLSRVRLFATPWTAAHQAFLSITNSRSLLKLMSIEILWVY